MGIPEHWDGEERRSIPIHVIHYMDAQVAEVKSIITGHTDEELQRFMDILKKIDDHTKASEARHNELVERLTVIAGRQELMEQAFPRDDNGDPDFRGHSSAHKNWMKRADDDAKLMAYVREQMDTDTKRRDDIRFVIRAIFATVCGMLVIWAAKELLADAVRVAQPAAVEHRK